MDDIAFLKILVVIVTMVTISALAEGDSNNPMTEIGIPVAAEDFSLYDLANRAPQVDSLQSPTFESGEKYCWISWFCPDIPFSDEVAKAIHSFAVNTANFFIFIGNAVTAGGFIIFFLIFSFLTLFNFASWGVFQGSLFLTLFGVSMTVLMGGAVALWVLQRALGAIPFMGS